MTWPEKIRRLWRQAICFHLWHPSGAVLAIPGGPAVEERCIRCEAKRVRAN